MLMEVYTDGLHPDISATLNNLGVLLRDMGNSDDAIEHYQEALRIRQLTLGETHPLTAFSHMNVARFLLDLEQFEDARPHATQAYEIMSEALVETHLHLLLAGSTVARIYLHDREYARAETLLQHIISNMDEEFVPGWIIEEANRWLAVARNDGGERRLDAEE
ncbi:MAG: tetratricopeptide repeat protein [Balneolaceae bacterium]|nr:MAG: tetratricopeptide repeat protein [Balneolaceae bacterium]